MEKGSNEHNLENAGNTVGQLYNTSKYDSNYKRKKGMRFFTFMVILVFLGSVIFLMINPYSDIVIMYADNNKILVHEVKVNVLGNYKFKDSTVYDYEFVDFNYGKLKGKAAQLAMLIRLENVDLLFAEQETLLELGLKDYTSDHSQYTRNTRSEVLLRYDLFENDIDLMYGLKIPSPSYINFDGKSAMSITSYSGSKHYSRKEWGQLVKFIDGIIDGADYISGKF